MMKRLAGIALFALFHGAAWAEHPFYSDATAYPDATIDLTRKVDLKMLFDGGLRPTRTMGLESQSCDASDVRVKILFPENRAVTLLVMRATFHVDADQNILSMGLEGPMQAVKPAVAQAENFCDMLSLPKGNLAEILALQGPFDYHKVGWAQDADVPGSHVRFILRPIYLYGQTMADLSLFYNATLHPPINFSRVPIQPPTGYETVSMTSPLRHLSELPNGAFGLKPPRAVFTTAVIVGIALVMLVFVGVGVVVYRFYRSER